MNHVRPCIASMKGYIPVAKPVPQQKWIKLNSNENPFPPSPKVKEILRQITFEDLRFYPDPASFDLRNRLAALYGFSSNQIICGNGSSDILNITLRTFTQPGEAIGFYQPSYPLYGLLGIVHDAKTVSIPLSEPYDQPPTIPAGLKVFFLSNPNNPLGFAYPTTLVAQLASSISGILVVDEAYAEFADENALELVRKFENIIIVRTLSKAYSLAGLRLGYAIGNEKWISEMMKVKEPFNVSRLTQEVAAAALEDQEYMRSAISQNVQTRDWFSKEAATLGFRVIPSQANFIFIKPPKEGRGLQFYEFLLDRNVLTRYFDEDLLRDGLRMTIGKKEEMAEILKILINILPDLLIDPKEEHHVRRS